ncbi:hypothetical protein HYE67_002078 [Fusarium culmorum]|uniref:Zn(2)-C6 fungal-type domain-containing protein n=1 Tax=Fusarium culmorum TaxID=5516 RepID=A0A7S8HSI4_FUSCU|nr:hypothetical protein HYE67_002078 [Fusarium culmorum]
MSSSRPHPSPSNNELPSSVSGFRRLLPGPISNSEDTSSGSGQGPSLQPRLLPRANVTKIACESCRKRRAKCSGERPKCKACIDRGLECHYQASDRDLHILKRSYDEIQEKANIYERLYHLLRNLPERESHDILRRLREGPDVATTMLHVNNGDLLLQLASAPETRLCNGQTVDDIPEWLGGVLPLGGDGLLTVAPRSDDDANRDDASASASASAGGASGAASSPLDMGPQDASTVATQKSALRSDLGQSNPWHSSTHSQTSSMRSNRQAKAMSSAKSRRALSQSRIASWAESMQTDHTPDGLPRSHGLGQVLFTLDKPELKHSTKTWTTITNDINLILHLLALYFCWEYPIFASLSKEHFLRDFRDGRHRYCSPLLVNALLALGCRFSTHPKTRANSEDLHSAGDHFFKESRRLFDEETDHHSFTTIQALGIMSIREASCGRGSESRYYAGQSIQLAFEMALHRTHDEGDKDELAVQLATFWGAFSLDKRHSGFLTRTMLRCEQRSNERSVYQCFCELSKLIHQSLYLLYSPGKPLTARGLLSIYTEYLDWYDRIPEVLRLGHNFTPAVLFVHMYYQFAILLLFRPLIKLRIIESGVSPRDVCLQAANAMQGFLTSYSWLYTLKRAPSFVPYFALTSSIMHLAIMATTVLTNESDMALRSDPNVSEAVKQGIASLAEMTPYHHIAEQAPYILRYLAKKWNIDVDIDTGAALNPEEYERLVRPFVGNLDLFAPTMVAEDFVFDLGAGKDVEERTSRQVGKAAESMEDLLFLPFVMQGRPMLSKGNELEEAGFAVL